MSKTMSTLLEITHDEDAAASMTLSAATPVRPDRPRRCPRCGHVEHTDSEIPGTCVFCPGLVELEPA
jgi:hypothetical protein